MSYSLLLLLGIMGHTDPIPVAIRQMDELESPVLILGIRGNRGLAFSAPQESIDDFVSRSKQGLVAFTQDTGWEACAQICRNNNGEHAWRATTSGSHVFCVAIDVCPAGFNTTGISVHTHPALATFKANHADANAMKVDGVVEGQWLFSGSPIGFSEPDMLGNPGYLIEPSGRILFQEYGDVRVVQQETYPRSFMCSLASQEACNPFQAISTGEAPGLVAPKPQ